MCSQRQLLSCVGYIIYVGKLKPAFPLAHGVTVRAMVMIFTYPPPGYMNYGT
jgi:hypothetical protein